MSYDVAKKYTYSRSEVEDFATSLGINKTNKTLGALREEVAKAFKDPSSIKVDIPKVDIVKEVLLKKTLNIDDINKAAFELKIDWQKDFDKFKKDTFGTNETGEYFYGDVNEDNIPIMQYVSGSTSPYLSDIEGIRLNESITVKYPIDITAKLMTLVFYAKQNGLLDKYGVILPKYGPPKEETKYESPKEEIKVELPKPAYEPPKEVPKYEPPKEVPKYESPKEVPKYEPPKEEKNLNPEIKNFLKTLDTTGVLVISDIMTNLGISNKIMSLFRNAKESSLLMKICDFIGDKTLYDKVKNTNIPSTIAMKTVVIIFYLQQNGMLKDYGVDLEDISVPFSKMNISPPPFYSKPVDIQPPPSFVPSSKKKCYVNKDVNTAKCDGWCNITEQVCEDDIKRIDPKYQTYQDSLYKVFGSTDDIMEFKRKIKVELKDDVYVKEPTPSGKSFDILKDIKEKKEKETKEAEGVDIKDVNSLINKIMILTSDLKSFQERTPELSDALKNVTDDEKEVLRCLTLIP